MNDGTNLSPTDRNIRDIQPQRVREEGRKMSLLETAPELRERITEKIDSMVRRRLDHLHPEFADKIVELIQAEVVAGKREAIANCMATLLRKKGFYEGAHGDHWEGFISALDTLYEEYQNMLAELGKEEK